MRIYNVPSKCDKNIYELCTLYYLSTSKKYIETLYTVGNVNYPGISDLDLIVIPKMNYLAPINLEIFKQTPKIFRHIIHHNPFIVPLSSLKAWKYSPLNKPNLIFGYDFLREINKDNSDSNKIALLLEHLYSYLQYYDKTYKASSINARLSVPIYSSFRFTINYMYELNIINNNNYGRNFDYLRDALLNRSSANIILKMRELFNDEVLQSVKIILKYFNIENLSKSSISSIINGDNTSVQVIIDKALLAHRQNEIKDYMLQLTCGKFFYGSMFRTDYYGMNSIPYYYRILRKIILLTNKYE